MPKEILNEKLSVAVQLTSVDRARPQTQSGRKTSTQLRKMGQNVSPILSVQY